MVFFRLRKEKVNIDPYFLILKKSKRVTQHTPMIIVAVVSEKEATLDKPLKRSVNTVQYL
jgi:hypothetical protein